MMNLNAFFGKIFSSPSLLWKGGAGLLFLALAFAISFLPNLTGGLDTNTRYAFSGLLVVYAVFRLGTFYAEFKRGSDE